MITATVTKLDQTKNGKPVVYFDNKHDYKEAYFLGKSMPPPMGAVIEVDTKASDFNGKTLWFVQSWKFASGAQPVNTATYAPPAPVQGQAPYISPAPSQSAPAGLPMEPGDVLRFISNVVGQAINAKTIADPMDITAWAAEALSVARKLRDGSLRAPEPREMPPPAGQTSSRFPMNDTISEKDIGF